MRVLLTAISTIIFFGQPTTAEAQPPVETAARFAAEAQALMRAGDVDSAITKFVIAFAHDPNPQHLMNLARAYDAKGTKTAATHLYRRVAAWQPGTRLSSQAQSRLAQVRGSAPTRQQNLTLTVIPPGATVHIDGRLVGKAPIPPVALSAGPHNVTIEMPGYQTLNETIQMTGSTPISKLITMRAGSSTPSQAENLQITGLPLGASVAVNGQAIAAQGNIAAVQLRPGLYTVRITAPGQPTFVSTVTIGSGRQTVAYRAGGASPSHAAARSGPSTSLVGEWFGQEQPDAWEDRRSQSARLSMESERRGILTIQQSAVLPRWKQRQCGGAQKLSWTVKYAVRLEQMTGSGKLFGSVVNLECSCEGQCRTDDLIEWDLLIPSNKNSLVHSRYLFQRMRGSTPPAYPVRKQPDLIGISGAWQIQWGVPGEVQQASAMLTGGSKEFSGIAKFDQTTTLARWRRKDCGGKTDLTATQHYKITATLDGDRVKINFEHERSENCNCSASACVAAGTTAKLPSGDYYLSLDGTALINASATISK